MVVLSSLARSLYTSAMAWRVLTTCRRLSGKVDFGGVCAILCMHGDTARMRGRKALDTYTYTHRRRHCLRKGEEGGREGGPGGPSRLKLENPGGRERFLQTHMVGGETRQSLCAMHHSGGRQDSGGRKDQFR